MLSETVIKLLVNIQWVNCPLSALYYYPAFWIQVPRLSHWLISNSRLLNSPYFYSFPILRWKTGQASMDYGKIFYERSELNKVGIYAFKARENLTAKKIRLILGLYRALSSEFK